MKWRLRRGLRGSRGRVPVICPIGSVRLDDVLREAGRAPVAQSRTPSSRHSRFAAMPGFHHSL